MLPEEKLKYFQYVLHKLLEWNSTVSVKENQNDLSILKSMKLLFFVSAESSINSEYTLIDNVFNNYSALPYGHVEMTVYSEIKRLNGHLEFFTIDNSKTNKNENFSLENLTKDLNENYLHQIDFSIDSLKTKNINLIIFSAFQLVELSHIWFSWRKNYNEAIISENRKKDIPVEEIKKEIKIYNLEFA